MDIKEIGSNQEEINEEIPYGEEYLPHSKKYKGIRITYIPTYYLIWYLDNIKDISEETKNAIDREINNRKKQKICFGQYLYEEHAHLCQSCDISKLCYDETDENLFMHEGFLY